MKAIKTLVKLQQKKLDQLILAKKTTLIDLEQKELALIKHQNEVKKEFNEYINSNLSIFLEDYLFNAKKNEYKIRQQISALTDKLNTLNTEIHESFAEIKRFEIILEQYKQKLLKKELLAETKALDENTILKYTQTDK